MTDHYKRVVGPMLLPELATDLYTVPEGQRFSIRNLYINNPSGVTVKPSLTIEAPTVPSAIVSNSFEGGTDGVTISAANSGGASGTAWNTVSIAATHTLVYDDDVTLGTPMCAAFTAGGTSGSTQVDWRTAETADPGPVIFTRFYFMYAAWPIGLNNRLMYLYSPLGALRGGILCNNDDGSGNAREFTFADGSNTYGGSSGMASTVQLSPGVVYRMEAMWTLSTTVGQVILKCFVGDSTEALETLISPANQNFGATVIGGPAFGMNDSGSSTQYPGTLYMDGMAMGTTGWLGPMLEERRILELRDIEAGESLMLRRRQHHTLEQGERIQGYYDEPTFPATTAVLDDFNRADEGPQMNTNWDTLFGGTQVISNTYGGASAAGNLGYWNKPLGPDQEAWATISTRSVGAYNGVAARVEAAGGYLAVAHADTPNDYYRIYKVATSGEVYTTLGSTITGPNFAAGDKIALRAIGNTLYLYLYQSGAWTLITSVSDTTYNGPYIGIYTGGTASRMDDFGGGNIAPVLVIDGYMETV